jgi:Ca-activated chloride channel family protein
MFEVVARLDGAQAQHPGIAGVWARWKINDLSLQELRNPSDKLKEEILTVSRENRLLCRYTAFLAVDSAQRTEGEEGVTVPVAVPVPDGVRYDTTVSE